MNERSEIAKVERLACQLEAIANWQQDQVSANTTTASMLLDASKWLRKLARNMCGEGFVGCRGGEDCDSDHK